MRPPSSLRRMWLWIRPPQRAMWVFPLVVIALVLVLTTLGVSGTSTPMLGGADDREGVIFGTPRSVRSDEWLVRTPLIVSQAERGFPRMADVGVGAHDMSVISDLPVANWTELFHPQHLAYHVLPIENAFAFEWWTTSALLLLGAYALILVLLKDWRWAALGALVLWGSPFFHWWYVPAIMGSASWILIAVAALVSSLGPELSRWQRSWRVALLGYSLACFALILYPPVQIAMAVVALAIVLGWGIQRRRYTSLDLRRLLINVVIAAAFAGMVVLAFVATRREALRAIADSVYPGDRRVLGGGGGAGLLVDAWFGWSFISNDEGMRPVLGNESEASSFLFVAIFAIGSVGLLWRDLDRRFRSLRGILVGLMAAMVLLGVHIFVGWGSVLSRVTLLDRVPAERALIGLGVASSLGLVVLAYLVDRSSPTSRRRVVATAVLLAVGGSGIVAFGVIQSANDRPIDPLTTLVALSLFVLPAIFIFWRPLLALGLLALVGVALSVPANPLVSGLRPLTESTFVRDVRVIRTGQPTGGWVTNEEGIASMLAAAGVDSVSMTNLYPNEAAWRILDTEGTSPNVWNRYEHVYWLFDDNVVDPYFTLLREDLAEVRISPCDQRLTALGVRFVASWTPLSSSCLSLEKQSEQPDGTPVYIYVRSAGPS